MNKETYLTEYPKHESMRENVKKDKNRLHFHMMPPTGWMNDPNGLCEFQGVNHIYFQYTPFLAGWGTKLWGHYTTKDWIHYKEEEPFLYPDEEWDRDGVYSGSAYTCEDGIHYFYTGNVKLWDKDYDYIMNGREQNTIHVFSPDGKNIAYKKLVMTNDDYPVNMSKHVRDPKIYKKDGRYYMIQGGRDAESYGCALLFCSDDLEHWKWYDTVRTAKPFGYMWECPDLFEIDGQQIMTCCPLLCTNIHPLLITGLVPDKPYSQSSDFRLPSKVHSIINSIQQSHRLLLSVISFDNLLLFLNGFTIYG